MKILPLLLLCISGSITGTVMADAVEIVAAVASRQGSQWQFDVTLRHPDSGWDHYADRWRIIDPQGGVLGERILYHPHEHEQPFTRRLSGVVLPKGIGRVEIEAHDTVDGWSPARLSVTIGSD